MCQFFWTTRLLVAVSIMARRQTFFDKEYLWKLAYLWVLGFVRKLLE